MAESSFRQQYGEIMKEVWNREIQTLAVHAGAEAGYFARKMPGIEIVTLGPMMEDVHSPMERLDLASFGSIGGTYDQRYDDQKIRKGSGDPWYRGSAR